MPDRAAADALRARANTPKCATPKDALAAALLAATEHPLNVVLSDITFGRYAAEGAGWYWELKFTQVIGMTTYAGETDSLDRRIKSIVTRWDKDIARYEGTPGNDETGGQD
jgi:hypothetical protein